MIVLKPPSIFQSETKARSIFLAGSIEMGKAEDWQARVAEGLEDTDLVLLSPRRDDWDPTWEQKIENPKFREQVEWELDALTYASSIFLYLSPGTMSPISLLELGLFATSGKLVVCCPEGFWRKGNVDIVCKRYGVPQVATLDEGIELYSARARWW